MSSKRLRLNFSIRPQTTVNADAKAETRQIFPPKSPKLSARNGGNEQSLPYGYENVLPKRRSVVDERSAVSSVVYDKSRYQSDTSTITSTTSDDVLSTSDEEQVDKRRIRPKRRTLR